ncbi:MAG: hypothetical protein FD145_887 [Candidatus Saganbacteria bacterium]|uniref:Glycosyltransferase 2-like domain-containing protein n=1 Tax=Candidatus Saganbacteria bacterium TaxID=2575572 RepID=A0A833NYH6_UNCSA|nr:MAG: hypothetical protein FD145_887 [Candidatus Saganbacteria bacterium]
MTTMRPITLIMNAYNEAETIENEVRSFHENIISKIPGSQFIIAEDGSTDGTSEILERLASEIGIIHSTSKERKGYTKALKDAFKLAKTSYIFFSDSGGKHNPQDFWKLYPFCKSNDLVIGVKTSRNDQWYRKLLTWAYNLLLSYYFGVKLSDADSGFRIYSKRAVDKIFNEEWINKELIASEITLRAVFSGFTVKETPISYNQRKGESRGLPLKKIPSVIIRVLFNFPKLKNELNSREYKK